MQFLKTLFWVALAVILVLFASANWKDVTVDLWGGLQMDVKLPMLVLVSFLLGLVPMLLIHQARIWTMRRRIDTIERNVTLSRPAETATTAELHAPAQPAPSITATP